MCSTVISTAVTEKVYTRKELVFLDTSIIEFHEKFYIPEIQKLKFHFTHVRILGTHHYGKELREEFNRRGELHNILCWFDYSKQVVSSFSNQIQS